MSWTAQIEGIDQVVPELRAAVHAGLVDGMNTLGVEGVRMVQDNIASPYDGLPPAVAFGNLLHGVLSQVTDNGATIDLVIGESAAMGADQYAAPVETGTRPHMPPSAALVLWVKKKFGADNERDALSMAFAIAHSLAKKGTRGHQMFSRALDTLQPEAVPVLEKAIAMRLAAAGYTGAA